MFNLKPELREGEAVLGEYGATVYMVRGDVSSAGSNIRLWLTNQRLILKAGLGPQRTLPLHAIADIREQKVMLYNMVRIEFAGGHLEWFTVENQAQFLQALEAARVQAPEIPEAVSPAAPVAASKSPARGAIIVTAVVVVGIIIVVCVILTVMGGLWFFISAQ